MTPTSPYTPTNPLAIETLLQFKQVDCEFSLTDIRASPANRLTSRRGIKLWNCTIPLSPAADSRKIAKVRGRLSRMIAKVRGRLSRAARPRFSAGPLTGLQTGLHTTGLDIMSYDIQIFHVLVTPG
ncbi:unnamed protein product [Boreogadus saida]